MSDWRYRLRRASRHAARRRCSSSSCSRSTPATIRRASPPTWCRPPRTRACCSRWSRWRRRLVVLTAGIDLSVGMVFVLDQLPGLVRSSSATRLARCSASSACCSPALACGAINGLIVIYGRLQPIVTTIATGAIYYGIALLLRPRSRRRRSTRPLADALTGQLFGGMPASLVALARRRARRLDSLSGARRSAAPPMRSARPRSRPICRACRSRAPSSSPIRSPACSRRSAASS